MTSPQVLALHLWDLFGLCWLLRQTIEIPNLSHCLHWRPIKGLYFLSSGSRLAPVPPQLRLSLHGWLLYNHTRRCTHCYSTDHQCGVPLWRHIRAEHLPTSASWTTMWLDWMAIFEDGNRNALVFIYTLLTDKVAMDGEGVVLAEDSGGHTWVKTLCASCWCCMFRR